MDEDTYLNQFRPHLMDVVYTWANGSSFAQICKMTDVFEGRLATTYPDLHMNVCNVICKQCNMSAVYYECGYM